MIIIPHQIFNLSNCRGVFWLGDKMNKDDRYK